MSSSITLLRIFILIKYKTDASQLLLTTIILLLKQLYTIYSLYQNK